MKLFQKNRKSIDDPVACVIIFFFILGLLLLVASLKNYYILQILYGYLFFIGWFSWTFLEYMFHRFAWHSKRTNKANFQSDTFNHLHHHQHPTEIKMSKITRCLLVAGSFILVFISIWIHDYFTILAGFVCGFTTYNLMHLLLHQKLAQKIFPKKVRYHIYHHCRYPDKCFGISVTWWDDLFGTVPHQKNNISTKAVDFYFGEKSLKSASIAAKAILIFVIILSFQRYVPAQNKSFYYEVLRNGDSIGYLNAFEKTKDNKIFLTLKSEVKARFIFSYSNYVTESAIFENGVMVTSNYYQRENGKETTNTITSDGNYFKMISDGRADSQVFVPVYNNYLQMFFYCPGNIRRIYSNHYHQFLSVKKITESKYRLTLPDGNYNYYNYQKGICTRVDVERALFTIHFVLKKYDSF